MKTNCEDCTVIRKELNQGKVFFLVSESSLEICIPFENRVENWPARERVERICARVTEMMRESN